MQMSLTYLDQSAIEEVPVDLWREVFDTLSWPPSLTNKQDRFTHDDVAAAIRSDELSESLLYALESLHTLGTEAGREAIIGIMQERRVQLQALPEGASERELAMRLYLGQRTDASLADVFARAQVQVQESGDQRRYNEFLGIEPRPIQHAKKKGEQLCAAVLQHCKDADLGEHVKVDVLDDDGIYVFSILRTDRMKKPLGIIPGQVARRLIPHRPVHGDLLRYESNLGRLRIAARTTSMVECYRKILGEVLFNDPEFFKDDAICSLSVLQERGRAALENLNVYGVINVRLAECTWECGDRSIMVLRDRDCFSLIERHGLSLTEGSLIQAKLKVSTHGRSTRPVTVNIRVPSRIEVSQRTKEPLMDELLDELGIRTTPPPAPKADLWSLHPWRLPLPIWRTLFGNATDELVKQNILHRTQLEAVPHPDHPTAGNVLRVHQVSAGEFQGVSDILEVPSRSLSATDVEGLELNPEQLRLYLQNTLGITCGGVAWSAGNDVLELGFLPVGDELLYVAYALRQPSSDISNRLRAQAAGAHPILIVPANRPDQNWGATVSLDDALPERQQVIRKGIYACGIADSVPAIHRAPAAAELVIDTNRKKIWIKGIELQITPDTQGYLFVEMLARGNGAPVSADSITAAISAARLETDGTTTARQAKIKAKKPVEKALAESGAADLGDPFPAAGTGYYRCVLKPFVD